MRSFVQRADALVGIVEKAVIFAMFLALIAALFFQVLSRFLLEVPLGFTEELSRVLLMWLVFVGAARGTAMVEHFVVDVVVDLLPRGIASALTYLVDAVCIAFLLAIAWISLRVSLGASTQILPALQVSILVQNLALPCGFVLMIWHALVLLVGGRHIGEAEAMERRVEDLVEQPRGEGA